MDFFSILKRLTPEFKTESLGFTLTDFWNSLKILSMLLFREETVKVFSLFVIVLSLMVIVALFETLFDNNGAELEASSGGGGEERFLIQRNIR